MRSWSCLLIALTAGISPGCSNKPNTPPELLPNEATYARDVKQDIHDLVNATRGKPKLARERGAVLVEKLEVYETQPVGENGPIFADLLAKARQLAEKDRNVDDVNRILDQLLKLANQLPGEVQRAVKAKSSQLAPSPRQRRDKATAFRSWGMFCAIEPGYASPA